MAEEKRRSGWKLALTIITLVALAALCYFARDQIVETFHNFGEVNNYALVFMLVGQAINYVSYGKMYVRLFEILNEKIEFKNMLRVVLELNFVNNIFPSGGVSSFSYFGVRMKAEGVSTGKSTLVQMMRFILTFVSFQVLLFLGLVILAIGGSANGLTLLVGGSLATCLFIGTLVVAYIVGSKRRINAFFTFLTRAFNRLIHVFRRAHPETINIARVEKVFTELHENYMLLKNDPKVLKRPLWFALWANIGEIITIYVVFVAFGQWVNPGAVIIAYAVANFAGLISVLPGGVGIYEALMTGVLAAAGVPAGTSLPVIVMYRILNMTLQLTPGYYFYHKSIRENKVQV
jgi:uncharacterized protein (TIRG00374 family)